MKCRAGILTGAILFCSGCLFFASSFLAAPHPARVQVKAPSQGAGAADLLSGIKAHATLILTNRPREWILPWKYPAAIITSNYWWNLEATLDFRTWQTVATNVTEGITVTNSGPWRFFRLVGRTDF